MGFLKILLGVVIGLVGFLVLFYGLFTASLSYITNQTLGLIVGLVCLVLGLAMVFYARKMIREG
jgi:divalent metal cation (Fe/Co/Zn/Cd) transporter